MKKKSRFIAVWEKLCEAMRDIDMKQTIFENRLKTELAKISFDYKLVRSVMFTKHKQDYKIHIDFCNHNTANFSVSYYPKSSNPIFITDCMYYIDESAPVIKDVTHNEYIDSLFEIRNKVGKLANEYLY